MPLTYTQAIDGGTISFEDGTKSPEEYAPARKVRVELTFTTADGGQDDADQLVAQIGDLARSQVARLLGQTAAPVQEAGEAASPPAPKPRTRRTQAQIAADEAAAKAGTGSGPQTSGEGGGAQTSVDDFDPTAGIEPKAVEHDPSDITGGDDFTVQPKAADGDKPVTDADLNSAVQKKNAEIANPDAIRELIGGYNPDPTQVFQLRQIPAGDRAEFLTKLSALKKAD